MRIIYVRIYTSCICLCVYIYIYFMYMREYIYIAYCVCECAQLREPRLRLITIATSEKKDRDIVGDLCVSAYAICLVTGKL